jgi:hypothetical protein
MLVSELDQASFLLGVALAQPLAHVLDELAAAVGTRLQAVGDLADREIGLLQFLFIDIGVVNPVDVERAKRIIVRDFIGLIVFVAKRFEEIHVDDRGSGGDDRVHHIVAHEVRIEVHAAARRGRAGNDEDDRAVLVLKHHVVDVRGSAKVARCEAHLPHRVDDRAGVETLDVDMLDGAGEKLRLAGVVDLVLALGLGQRFGRHYKYLVIPAEAGIPLIATLKKTSGIPACAGMTQSGQRLVR